MRELASTITSKGQVTVPAEVRKRLGLRAGDKLLFVVAEDGTVALAAPRYRDVASLRGAAGSLAQPVAWSEVRATAREDRLKTRTAVRE